MRLFFWEWEPPPPVVGQSPAATRYRTEYRVNAVTGITALLVAVVVLWP